MRVVASILARPECVGRHEVGILGVVRARALSELLFAEQCVVFLPGASGLLPFGRSGHADSPFLGFA